MATVPKHEGTRETGPSAPKDNTAAPQPTSGTATHAAAASQRVVAMLAEEPVANWSTIGAAILALCAHVAFGFSTISIQPEPVAERRVEMRIARVHDEPDSVAQLEPVKKPRRAPQKSKATRHVTHSPRSVGGDVVDVPSRAPTPVAQENIARPALPVVPLGGVRVRHSPEGRRGPIVRVGPKPGAHASGAAGAQRGASPNRKPRGGGRDATPGGAGNAVPSTSRPVIIKKSVPHYPKQLKDEGIEGIVVLKILVDEDGRVRGTKVIKSLHPVLDQLARTALKKSRFAPGRKDGRPVKTTLTYRFEWEIID